MKPKRPLDSAVSTYTRESVLTIQQVAAGLQVGVTADTFGGACLQATILLGRSIVIGIPAP